MRKNFLLLLWLTLLPLAGWAQTVSWKSGGTSKEVNYTGDVFDLSTLIDVFGTGGSSNVMCVYTAGYTWVNAATNGSGFANCNKWNYSVHANSTEAASPTGATVLPQEVGTYKVRVWARFQDGSSIINSRDYKVLDLVIKKQKADVAGISLATGLEYADGPQSLISGDPTYPADYYTTEGGMEYIVKDVDAMPAATDAGTDKAEETNVGTYFVYARVKGDGKLYDTGDWYKIGSTGVTIAKREIKAADFTFAPVEAELTYNGTDQVLNQEIAWTNTIKRGDVQYAVSGGSFGDVPVTGKDAGTYTVQIKITPDGNHLVNGGTVADILANTDITKEIKQATPEITTDPAEKTGLVYTGSAQPLITDGVSTAGTDILYKLGDGSYSASIPEATNAGTYTITYYVESSDANYTDKGSDTEPVGTITVTIDKAKFTVNQTLADAGVVYNAEEQSILKGEIHKGTGMPAGTVKYTIGEEVFGPQASSSPSFVKKTNAGTYEVAWEAYPKDEAEAKNYIPAKGTVTATISRAPLHMGAQGKNVTYGTTITYYDLIQLADDEIPTAETLTAEELKDLLVTFVSFEGGTIDAGKVTELPTDAGEWDFVLGKNDDGSNYELKNFIPDGTLTITKIDATPATVAAATLEYNGADQELVTIPDPSDAVGGTQLYYLETVETGAGPIPAGDARWSEEIPVATKAGKYNVWTMIKGNNNHNDVVATDAISVEIAKKPLANTMFELTPELNYTGADQKSIVVITATDMNGEKNAITSDDYEVTKIEFGGNTVTEVKNAGEYTYTFTGKGNYQGTAIAKIKVEQALAVIATPPSAKELTYSRVAQDLVNPGTTNDGTVLYSLTGNASDFSADLPQGTDAGPYTVYYMVQADANHTNSDVFGPVSVTIAKAAADPEAPVAINRTYNGEYQTLVNPATFKDGFPKGTFKYFVGKTAPDDPESDDWKAAIPEEKNAGKYTVQTLFIPNDNHFAATVAAVPAEIKQASIGYALSSLTKPWDGELIAGDDLNKLFTVVSGKLFGDDQYDVPFEFVLPENYLNAGTYSFTQADYKFKKTKDGDPYPENYVVNFTGTGNIVINTVNIESGFTLPTPKLGLKYDGEPHDLLNPGEVTALNAPDYPDKEIAGKPFGEFVYALEDEDGNIGKYTATVPDATPAGKYTVWYKIAGDRNHNDTEAKPIEVTIANKALKDEFFVLTANEKGTEYLKADLMPTISTVKDEPITSDDYDVTITFNGKEVKELINAGTYTFTFTPSKTSNYSGSAKATFEITTRPAQAVAYNATKVYDGIAGLEKPVKFSFTNLVPGDDDAIKMGDAVYFEDDAHNKIVPKNAGVYTMLFDLAAFDSQNYKVMGVEDTGAKFTITKAPLTISWNEKAEPFTKPYGAENPKFEATSANVDLEGAIAGEETDIYSNIVFTRVDNKEDIGDYDLAMSANQIWKNDAWKDADVFDNYAYKFENPAEGAFKIIAAKIIVSLKPQTKTYDGVKVKTLTGITADDLVVTHLKGGNVKDAVFTTMPIATITEGGEEGVVDAGEYELTLAGAVATNYEIVDYFTSTYTIEAVQVNAKFNNKPVAVEGDDAKVIFDKVDWTVEADDEADQATVDAALAKDLFELQFTAGVVAGEVGKGGKIATDDGENALKLVYLGKETPANFEFIDASGDLNIGGENTEIALDDSKAIVTKATKKADVTFTQKRAVPEDVWQACVLPFTVSIEDLSDAFGYAAVDLFDKSRTNSEEVHFSLQVTGSIEAGTPFLFKTNNSTNFTDVMFEGVEVVATETLDPVVKDDDTNIQFIGTFEPVEFSGEQYRYLSKGTWYNAKNFSASKPVSLKPLRAYLNMEGAATARIFIEEPDGTVTAIDAVEFNNQAAEGLYNLNGMKVNQGLKGVYIQNGKKVIKK